jgi:hypothetical protein
MGQYYPRQEESIQRRRTLQIMGLGMYKSRSTFTLAEVCSKLGIKPWDARMVLNDMVEESLLHQVSDKQWVAPILSKELLTKRWV